MANLLSLQGDVGRFDDGAPAHFLVLDERRPWPAVAGPAARRPARGTSSRTSASFSAAAVSALIFWTMASGVPGGATRANQATATRSGRPISAAVGHVGRHRAAVSAARPKNFTCPALLEAQGGGDVADEDVDPAGRDVDQRRALALVGHVHQLDAGHGGEHLRRQVRGRAVALAGVGHLAGIGLGVGDQLLRRCRPGRSLRAVMTLGTSASTVIGTNFDQS